MVEKGDISKDKLDDETIENIKYIFERLESVIEEVTKKWKFINSLHIQTRWRAYQSSHRVQQERWCSCNSCKRIRRRENSGRSRSARSEDGLECWRHHSRDVKARRWRRRREAGIAQGGGTHAWGSTHKCPIIPTTYIYHVGVIIQYNAKSHRP